MNIAKEIKSYQSFLSSYNAKLVAVSKTKPNDLIMDAYNCGQRIFGENKVQELVSKHEALPKDIEWHMIGHLQTNKVKYIAPFVSLIHSVDSIKLLKEINKQAAKNNRIINILLQVHIAQEEHKFGFNLTELSETYNEIKKLELKNIRITGFMGMATNTSNQEIINSEFKSLQKTFETIKGQHPTDDLSEISMGMSNDYKIALENGSTLIRIGSAIFGKRNYV